MKQTV